MVIRKEKIELVSNDYNELMCEANKEYSDKKDNGWDIYFTSIYEGIDGYTVVLKAERKFQFDINAVFLSKIGGDS